MIKPTNGRVVLFTPSTVYPDACIQLDPKQPLTAMVVHVHYDRMVNLTVHDSMGRSWPMLSVPLLQDDDRKPESGYFCSWMEFQKGQAAKYDAAANPAKSDVYQAPATDPA